MEIPYHKRGNRDDDEVHEDAQGAGSEDEGAGVDACAAWNDFAIGIDMVHLGFRPRVVNWRALENVPKRGCQSISNVQPD